MKLVFHNSTVPRKWLICLRMEFLRFVIYDDGFPAFHFLGFGNTAAIVAASAAVKFFASF